MNETRVGRILVADDDMAILKLVTAVVEGEGLTAMAARDGKEAYHILKSNLGFVAALVDVRMPYIEGTDLIKFMQSDKKFAKIPVIIMTGERSAKITSAGLTAGAVALLPKPFTNDQLRTVLRTFSLKNGAR